MEDVREKGEEVEEVSIGLNGDWFLRTDARHGTFFSHGTFLTIPTFPYLPSPLAPLQPLAEKVTYTKTTDTCTACKAGCDQKDNASNVELFAQLIQKADFTLADYSVQFFTFVPNRTGYVTVLHKTDGSLTRCAWHNVPKQLDIVLEREAPNGVRHVAVGMNGSYVVLLNTGAMWWDGVPDSLHQLLDDALKKGRTVAVSVIFLNVTKEGPID